MELCACPQCGLPAEVVANEDGAESGDVSGVVTGVDRARVSSELVGVRCISRHWFFGLRERLVA